MDPIMIFKISSNVYNSISLKSEIECIHENIRNIYKNIGDAHFESAKQAITAGEKGNYEKEIYGVIIHLRDAYNILKQAVNAKQQKLFFFEKSLYGNDDKKKLFENSAIISSLISIIYRDLNQYENSIDWRNKAISDFLEHILLLPSDYFIGVDELSKINTRYVENYTYHVDTGMEYTDDSNVTHYVTRKEYGIRVSKLGDKYVNEFIKPQKAELFGLLIDKREIQFENYQL